MDVVMISPMFPVVIPRVPPRALAACHGIHYDCPMHAPPISPIRLTVPRRGGIAIGAALVLLAATVAGCSSSSARDSSSAGTASAASDGQLSSSGGSQDLTITGGVTDHLVLSGITSEYGVSECQLSQSIDHSDKHELTCTLGRTGGSKVIDLDADPFSGATGTLPAATAGAQQGTPAPLVGYGPSGHTTHTDAWMATGGTVRITAYHAPAFMGKGSVSARFDVTLAGPHGAGTAHLTGTITDMPTGCHDRDACP